MTMDELRAIPLRYCFGFVTDDYAVRQWRNDEYKIAKQTVTPRNPDTLEWGLGESTYMLLDTGEEFTNTTDLLAAINRREAA